MTTATTRSFTPIELAWVRAQTRENLSVTTVALVCKGSLDLASVKSRIEDRLLAEERLRQRMEPSHLPLARPRWQEHESFRLTDHVSVVEATAGQPAKALAELVGQLSSQPLDEGLPLWKIYLVDLAGETSALVLRLHASVADSRAAAGLALRLADGDARSPLTEIGLEHLVPLQPLRDRAGKTATATHTLCQLITCRADHDNPFRRMPIGTKSLSWSDPVDLESVRSQASRSGCSLTETLLSAVVSSLRKAVQRHDIPAEDMALRALVTLDLRQPEDPRVGTRSALGLLRLPLHSASSAERIEEVHREVERFAQTPEDLAILGHEPRLGLSMTEIEEQSLRLLSQKATAALAILDGPTDAQLLCGQPVSKLLWWPALNGNLALGISLVTYAGQVRFGVSCDQALDTDPNVLTADMARTATEI